MGAMVCFCSAALAAADKQTTVAIFPFTTTGPGAAEDRQEGIGEAVAQMLKTDLFFVPDLRLISPSRVSEVLRSADVPIPTRQEPGRVAAAAKLLGATHAIVGHVTLAGQTARADVRLIEMPGGAEVAGAKATGKVTELFDLMPDLSRDMAKGLGRELRLTWGGGATSPGVVSSYASAARATVLRQHAQALAALRQIGPKAKRNRYIRGLADLLSVVQWVEEMKARGGWYNARLPMLVGDAAVPVLLAALPGLDHQKTHQVLQVLVAIGPRTLAAEEGIFRALKHPHPSVRMAAVRSLRETQSLSAATARAIRDPESGVRRTAAWAASWLPEKEALNVLAEAIRDPDAEVRAAAGASLFAVGTSGAGALAKSLFADRNRNVRLAVARAWKLQVLAPELDRLMNDPDPDVQLAAARSLSECGREAGRKKLLALTREEGGVAHRAGRCILKGDYPMPLKRAITDKLLRHESKLTSGVYYVLVIAAAERISFDIRHLIRMMSDPNEGASAQVASLACTALGEVGGTRGVSFLTKCLSHPNKSIRHGSITALATRHSGKVRDSLAKLVMDVRGDPRRLTEILFAVNKANNPDYLDILVWAVLSKERAVRGAAARGIAELAPAGLIDRLRPMASDSYGRVRSGYARMLARIGTEKAHGILAEMAARGDPGAIGAIGALRKKKYAGVFRPLLDDRRKQTRTAAARYLAAMGDGGAVAELKKWVDYDPDIEVFGTAKAALAQIHGGPQATAALLNDPRPYVRIAAARQLALADKRPPGVVSRAVRDRNELVRDAARALLDGPAEAEVTELLQELKTRDRGTARLVASALNYLWPEGIPVVEAFVRGEKEGRARTRAIDVLERLCKKYRRPFPADLRRMAPRLPKTADPDRTVGPSERAPTTSADSSTQRSSGARAELSLAKAYLQAGEKQKAKAILLRLVAGAGQTKEAAEARGLLSGL